MTEPKTDGFVKGDGAQNPNKRVFKERIKMEMKRRKRKELLTEPSSEQMRTKYAGIERTDL